jgi:hypothetical protein
MGTFFQMSVGAHAITIFDNELKAPVNKGGIPQEETLYFKGVFVRMQ